MRSDFSDPAAIFFAALLIFSAALFCAAPGTDGTAFLWLLWAGFFTWRMLQLGEAQQSRDSGAVPQILPHFILRRLGQRQAEILRDFAASSMNMRMAVWLLLAAVYVLPAFAASARGPLLPEYMELAARMGGLTFVQHDPGLQQSLTALGRIFMAGMAFWLAQACALNRASALFITVAAVFAALAGLAAAAMAGIGAGLAVGPLSLFGGQGWGGAGLLQALGFLPSMPLSSLGIRLTEAGGFAAAFLYAACLFAVAVPFRHAFTGRSNLRGPLAGAALLAVMLIADIFLPAGPRLFALWLPCWALLGVIWARSGHTARKSYVMHQL